MVNIVTLVKVNEEYKEEALEFKKEFFDCNETVINGSALFDQLSFDDWMDLEKKELEYRNGIKRLGC